MISKYLMERDLEDLRRYLEREGAADRFILLLDDVNAFIEKLEDDLKGRDKAIVEANAEFRDLEEQIEDLECESSRLKHRLGDLVMRLEKYENVLPSKQQDDEK